MISLCKEFSVPQVFFNKNHIGSVKETLQTLDLWEKESKFAGYDSLVERFEMEILWMEDAPYDDRLKIPALTSYSSSLGIISPDFIKGVDNGGDEKKINTLESHIEDGGKFVLPNGSKISALQCTRDIMTIMSQEAISETKTGKYSFPLSMKRLRKKRMIQYKNYFTGQQAVNVFMKFHDMNNNKRVEAVKFGKQLLERGIIHPLTKEKKQKEQQKQPSLRKDFVDGPHDRYQLQPHKHPNVLNTFLDWKITIMSSSSATTELTKSLDPMNIIRILNANVDEIIASHTRRTQTKSTKTNSSTMDYALASQSKSYLEFEGKVGILQLISWDSIITKNNKNEKNIHSLKTVFCIHLYNLMVKHAMIHFNIDIHRTKITPKSFLHRYIQYNVGGYILSLEDIYHDILLLGNHSKKRRYKNRTTISQIHRRNPQKSLPLSDDDDIPYKVDYRIHFALDFVVKNSPMSLHHNHHHYYSGIHCHQEELLDYAAKTFCANDDHVTLNETKNELILSIIFKWYQEDFLMTDDDDYVRRRKKKRDDDDDTRNMNLARLLLSHLEGKKRQTLQRMMDSTKRIRIKYYHHPLDDSKINFMIKNGIIIMTSSKQTKQKTKLLFSSLFPWVVRNPITNKNNNKADDGCSSNGSTVMDTDSFHFDDDDEEEEEEEEEDEDEDLLYPSDLEDIVPFLSKEGEKDHSLSEDAISISSFTSSESNNNDVSTLTSESNNNHKDDLLPPLVDDDDDDELWNLNSLSSDSDK